MRRLEHEYKLMGLAPYAQKIDKSTYEIFDSCLELKGYKIFFKNKPKDFFHFEKNFVEKI